MIKEKEIFFRQKGNAPLAPARSMFPCVVPIFLLDSSARISDSDFQTDPEGSRGARARVVGRPQPVRTLAESASATRGAGYETITSQAETPARALTSN